MYIVRRAGRSSKLKLRSKKIIYRVRGRRASPKLSERFTKGTVLR